MGKALIETASVWSVLQVMHLVVLNIACPFAPVGPHAFEDGARIVTQLDIALTREGHDSIVMACEGSITEGILLATSRPSSAPKTDERHRLYEQYRFTLQKFLEKWPIDLIHMHGADFYEYLPPPGIPVLVTLHSPMHRFREEVFRLERSQTFFHCASAAQRSDSPPLPDLPPGIEPYFAVYERLVNEARAAEAALPETKAVSAFAG